MEKSSKEEGLTMCAIARGFETLLPDKEKGW
jgi:hypothetical protein